MIVLTFIVLALASFFVAALLTHFVRKKLLKESVLDFPNERSMHEAPIPRGGGLALLPVFLGGLVIVLPFSFLHALYLICGLGVLSYVCWRDDKDGMGILERLAAHVLAALIGSFALGPGVIIFGGMFPFWLDRVLLVLVWAGFMNLYNFMDGIDGITGTQAICNALGAALVLGLVSRLSVLDLTMAAAVAGGAAGFLLFNWHPARIFLGDVGSVPLGFLAGFLILRVAASGYSIAALLIPLYYLCDGGLTLALRFGRGEKIWQAHRTHFYQRAAAGFGRHDGVVLRIATASATLAALAALSVYAPWTALALGIATVTALLVLLDHMAGKK